MPLDATTPCERCRQTVWLHTLRGTQAWCGPKAPSPNLGAPEVMAVKSTLGQTVTYTLWKAAQDEEERRRKDQT